MSVILKDPLLKIRPMQASDIDAVFRTETRAYPFPWTLGILGDCLAVGYSCWVCEIDGEVMSHAIMSMAAGEAHVLNVCVDPDWQGQGVGQRMMRQLIRVAGEGNCDTLFLEVRESNAAAIALYTSLRFNEIHRRRGYYPADRGREDALVFALSLA